MSKHTAATTEISDYATATEVADAIGNLSAVDYFRLYKVARVRLAGSAYTDPRDLVTEAVVVPYEAALGRGGRRWRRTVPFMAYLCNTIRGLASDSRRSEERRITVSQYAKSADGVDRDLFSTRACPTTPSPEMDLIEQGDRERQAAVVAALRTQFKNDQEVIWIIQGIEGGMSPTKVQELSGMSDTQYQTARRRWRRGLERFSSNGDSNHE